MGGKTFDGLHNLRGTVGGNQLNEKVHMLHIKEHKWPGPY